jgi:prepilin-type N-terminal cleavage/methylation domain-containing protein
MNNLMKKGFSLIELMVVIAIASILLMVTANFLIFTIQRNNQASIENEVRNEANSLLDSVGKDIRNSSCECVSANSISLFGTSGCEDVCLGNPGPTPYAIYSLDETSYALKRNDLDMSSNAIKVRNCTGCTTTNCSDGFVISTPAINSREYTINLYLRQAKDNPRSDFCGKVQVQDTFTPRNN